MCVHGMGSSSSRWYAGLLPHIFQHFFFVNPFFLTRRWLIVQAFFEWPQLCYHRDQIEMVSGQGEDGLYWDIWSITGAKSIYKVLLSEVKKKNQLHVDFAMCTSNYCNSSTISNGSWKMRRIL